MVELIESMRSGGVAVVGAGGAGDIVSAYVTCRVLEDLFGVSRCIPVAVLWERWVLDPFPGPIPREALKGVRDSDCVWLRHDSWVERPGYRFVPQASIIARHAGVDVPGIVADEGLSGFKKCLKEVTDSGYRHVMALDVGGDILAEGHEEWLWSPLTDALTLAAVADLDSSVGVLAPGADGELPAWYVLERIEEAAELGGYLGSIGLWRDHVRIYEEILPHTKTEAGLIPYKALKGEMRKNHIREGSREVDINPTSPIIYILTTQATLKLNKLANQLKNTETLQQANQTAHKLQIPTELDLEKEIAKNHGTGPQTKPNWTKARNNIHKQIKKQP
ncbi:MAG: hypothetical protein DRO10_00195 [Thermoprotei archaeon]|nr:MAG: hypothetical protein DRO10_00195 [Thermoprotei archaeon]